MTSPLPGPSVVEDALRIARAQWLQGVQRTYDAALRAGPVRVVDWDECRARVRVYGLPSDEPGWVIYVPWGDGLDGQMLRSSRVIVVSKIDGRVVYDGSAHDEG